MTQIPIIELSNISFRYNKKNNWIVDDISLSISKGEKVGIIGSNGCGKSTLSKLIIGINKPAKGYIKLYNKKVKWNRHYPEMGYIGDPGYNTEELGLPGNLTVQTLIETIINLQCASDECEDIINLLELRPLFKEDINKLSTGQRKRLMACITFIRKPTMIILDEPFDGLDKNIKLYLSSHLKKLYEDKNITLLLISHSKIEIDTFTDKVYFLEKGKIKQVEQRYFNLTLNFRGKTMSYSKKLGVILEMLSEQMEESLNYGEHLSINLSPFEEK